MSSPVLAAHRWPNNAALIADVASLHLNTAMRTLDPTFGRGKWWDRWRPDELVTHNRKVDGVDFRALPHLDPTFDLVAFDPPYVCMGGRSTTGLPDFADRYGLADAPTTPAELQLHNDDGLAEVYRVLEVGGLALVKCQDYVSSGRLWPGTYLTLGRAYELGFELVDRFDHLSTGRAQPGNRTRKATAREVAAGLADEDGRIPSKQGHAQRRPSVLYVLRKTAPGRTTREMPGQLELIQGGAA